MLADNLTLFGSQVDNLKELRGFDDPNDSIMHNQSIMVNQPSEDAPFQTDNLSMVGSYRPPHY